MIYLLAHYDTTFLTHEWQTERFQLRGTLDNLLGVWLVSDFMMHNPDTFPNVRARFHVDEEREMRDTERFATEIMKPDDLAIVVDLTPLPAPLVTIENWWTPELKTDIEAAINRIPVDKKDIVFSSPDWDDVDLMDEMWMIRQCKRKGFSICLPVDGEMHGEAMFSLHQQHLKKIKDTLFGFVRHFYNEYGRHDGNKL